MSEAFKSPQFRWTLRESKLLAKKQVHKIGSRLRPELLRACFVQWQSAPTGTADSDPPGISSFDNSLRCKRLWWSASLQLHAQQLKASLKQAWRKSIEAGICALPPHASSSSVLQVVKSHQGTTNLSKLKPKALPQVKDADSNVCSTHQASMDTWVEYFTHMEGGHRIDAPSQHELWRAHLQELQEPAFDESLLSMPSLTDLELALRRVATNKATGPHGIPGELCRNHPTVLARRSMLKCSN